MPATKFSGLIAASTISALAAFASAGNAADPSGINQLAPGETQELTAHTVCRVVTNGGSVPIMVPTKADLEWSRGADSFLENFKKIPGVEVTMCRERSTLKPRPTDLLAATMQVFHPYEHYVVQIILDTISGHESIYNTNDGFRSKVGGVNAESWNSYTGLSLTGSEYLDLAYGEDGKMDNAWDWQRGNHLPSCEGRAPGVYLWRDYVDHGYFQMTQGYTGVANITPFVCE